MKQILFFCYVSIFCWMPIQAQDKVTLDADTESLTYFKEVLWPKAYREQDTTLLDSLLDDSFQMIDDQGGWYKKADEIAWISKNKPSYERFHYEIKRLDIYRNGTAVISGIGHMEGTDKEGKSYHTTYHSSNVLIKLDGEWKAINSHVSGIKRD